LIGTCPANPALQSGVKGHNMMNYLAEKPRPLRAGSFIFAEMLTRRYELVILLKIFSFFS
jgi:hypothetical protein